MTSTRAIGALSLVALIGLTPWFAGALDAWRAHDVARLAGIGIALGATLLLLAPPGGSPGAAPSPSARALVAFLLGFAVLRALLAAEPTPALREVAVFVGLASVATALGRFASVQALASVGTAATAAYAVTALLILALGVLSGTGAPFQRTGAIELFGYSHFRFYNHVQVVAVPLAVGVAALSPSARWRWVGRIGAATSLALLFHSFSRAAVLALTMASVVVVVASLWKRERLGAAGRRWVTEAALAAVAGIALMVLLASLQSPGSAPAFNPQVTGSRDESNLERMSVLRFALGQWAESPLWGVGPMHLAGMRGMIAAHPHNMWLQVAAEWGTPVLLGVVAALAVAGLRLWRALHGAPEGHAAWGLVLLATGVAVAVDALFSGNLVMPMPQLWIALLGGAWLAWWRELPGRATPSAPMLGRPLLVAMLAVQIWQVVSIAPEVRRLSAHLETLEQRYPNTVVNPRFWSHGWFGEPGPRR